MLRKLRHAIGGLWRALDLRGLERRRLAERIRQLKAESKAAEIRWKQERDALKRVGAVRHRRIPSPAVLESQLPLRARVSAARARRSDAVDLDRRLQQASPAYLDALARAGEPHPGLVRTSIQGLPWWVAVPGATGPAARDRFVAKQRFPYRVLSQTRELAQGPILIDIGANVGRMSIPRVMLGDFERAYCAEPDPLNYQALVRNVVDNGLRGLVLPDRVAISDVGGTARLQQAKYGTGHRLRPGHDGPDDVAPSAVEALRETPGNAAEPLREAGRSAGSVDVPCRTLDQWCRDVGVDLDLVTFVKVDTQGWEVNVLRGACDLLARPHIAWQIEVAPESLHRAGTSIGELLALCVERFTHFIDLSKEAEGPRARPTPELGEALSYLTRGDAQTDILLFNAAAGGRLAPAGL
jgi:FkbM family methyltransferase